MRRLVAAATIFSRQDFIARSRRRGQLAALCTQLPAQAPKRATCSDVLAPRAG